MSSQTAEQYRKYSRLILVLRLELLHNKYHKRNEDQYELRYQRFENGIDTQYVKCIVKRD